MSATARDALPHILAVDMGTGTAKVALVSSRGEIAASALRPTELHRGPGGAAEQDPAVWWRAVTEAAREALDAAALPPESVLAVRCTTQWAVTVPVDAGGEALCDALSWMDTRGGPHSREVAGGPLAGYSPRRLARWIRLTGGAPVLSGIDGLGHSLFLKHERPEIWARTAALLEPMDYLNLRLTGRVAATAATMYTYWLTDARDVGAMDYDPTLLRWAGIEREKLPDLVPVDAVIGTLLPKVARELALPAETPVLAGLNDLQAAAVGAGAVTPGRGYFSVGTTSWLSGEIDRKKTDVRHSLATMPAALPGRRVVVAEQGAAGRCLEWVAERILYDSGPDGPAPPDDAYEVLERLAAEVPAGSDGLIFTPWINGVGAPDEDPHTRSAFFNQSLGTTRGHYARAAMEGVAYNARWLRDHVERFAGATYPSLNFVGGGAQSDTWCQIFADVLGVEVGRVENPRYASALGTALSGFVALGTIQLSQLSDAVRMDRSFAPDAEASGIYDRQFDRFLDLYKANKRVYRRLNSHDPVHI